MGDKNVVSLFFDKARELKTAPCFHYKEGGEWKILNWTEVADLIHRYARGLMALGVTNGTSVALFSSTRMEWTLMDMAILATGGVSVPVYANLPQEHIDFILKDSGTKIAVVENDDLYAHLERNMKSGQTYDHIIQIQGGEHREGVTGLKSLLELGDGFPVHRVDQEIGNIKTDQTASYIYTSGTTGVQKGAIVSHGNLVGELDAIWADIRFTPEDVCLVCLPQAHVMGRMAEFYLLVKGCQSAFAESLDKLAENYREARPHFVVGVPRMLEKAFERIEAMISQQPRNKQKIFQWAKRTGARVAELKEKKQGLGLWLGFQYAIAKRLVFNKLLQRMGGRLYCFVSGGAPLNKEVAKFFAGAGVQVLEGYGLTETFAAVAANRFGDYQFGTVGRPLEGVEMKLDDDGEILVRGPMVFKGYLNRPDATEEAFDGDWYKTGDIGEFTPEGFLRITDRKKDIIVTAGGKNIAPQRIEGIMAESPYINQVMVHGDRKKFLTALITLNYDAVQDYAKQSGITYADAKELAGDPSVRDLIEKEIENRNRNLARFETIKRFAIVPEEFSIDNGEITPTLKIRRRFVTQKYKEVLEAMYRE
jgi:long-chain acyl-CoA synthetase